MRELLYHSDDGAQRAMDTLKGSVVNWESVRHVCRYRNEVKDMGMTHEFCKHPIVFNGEKCEHCGQSKEKIYEPCSMKTCPVVK